MQREQLALDQIGLHRLTQPDRHVRLAHGEVKLLFGGEQSHADVGIEVEELAEPRSQPVYADARRRRHLELAVRTLAAVSELGARSLELHEYVVRSVVKKLTLLGQNEPTRVAVEQRNPKLLLERGDLARHRRLRQTELLAGMREAAGLGGGVENLELIPIHRHLTSFPLAGRPAGLRRYSAATRDSVSLCAARKCPASSAAMQPWPAAVTAWR